MRVLVTGGAGFIGSNLARTLVRSGHEVVIADNLAAGLSLRLIEDLLGDLRFVHADVRSRADLERLPPGPWDCVYHLAASFANALSIEDPALDASSNVNGTAEVLELARRAGCGLFVSAASSSSYGDAPAPCREDGPMVPHTPYARTKLEGERRVQSSGLAFASFRLFNVYGPGDTPGPHRNAIPNMMKALDGDGALRVLGREATRDFTYVDDVVQVLVDARRAEGQVVNVATGLETPVLELAVRILDLFDLPQRRLGIGDPRPWDRVVRRCASLERLRSLYGIPPATSLEQGLAATAGWLHDEGFIQRAPTPPRPANTRSPSELRAEGTVG